MGLSGILLLPCIFSCVYFGVVNSNSIGVYDQGNQVASNAYNIDFMKELCRYVGVSYVRNPQDPPCKYIWCWNGFPYSMDCAPGRMVHPYFYWSEKDPCTEYDREERCLLGVLKRAYTEDVYEEPLEEVDTLEPVQNSQATELKNTMVEEVIEDKKPTTTEKPEIVRPEPEARVYQDVPQNYSW